MAIANARQLPEQLLPSALASLTQVSAGEVHAVLGSRRLVTTKQNKKQNAPLFSRVARRAGGLVPLTLG